MSGEDAKSIVDVQHSNGKGEYKKEAHQDQPLRQYAAMSFIFQSSEQTQASLKRMVDFYIQTFVINILLHARIIQRQSSFTLNPCKRQAKRKA